MTQEKDDKKKIIINKYIYIYLLYILVIYFSDTIIYICRINYFPAIILSSLLISGIHIKLIKKNISFEKFGANKWDIIITLFFIIVTIFKISIPDSSFDTKNYHILLQQNLAQDNINFSFFPGRIINTFTIPLSDRVYNLFRIILGFRAGTILNTLITILIYFQVKEILQTLLEKKNIICNQLILAVGAFWITCIDHTLWLLCGYGIDLLLLPLLLYFIKILLFEEKQTHIDAWLIALISGILVAFKLSIGPLVIFLDLLYVMKFKKYMKLNIILGCVFWGLLPNLLYMYINFLHTGNPVFPFANKIFKSPYFVIEGSVNDFNGVNATFGVRELKEYFTWPVNMLINPERTNDVPFYSGRLTIIFLVVIISYIVNIIRRKKTSKQEKLILILLIFMYILLVGFLNGYIRYILILEILGSIFVVYLVIKYFLYDKTKILGGVIVFISTLQLGFLFNSYFVEGIEPSWRQGIYKDIRSNLSNLELLLKDTTSNVQEDILEDIDLWGIVDFNSAYADLLKPGIPIVSLNAGVVNEKTAQLLKNHLSNNSNRRMYTILDDHRMDELIVQLNDLGFKIEAIQVIKPSFIDQRRVIYIAQIIKKDNLDMENILVQTEQSIEIPIRMSEEIEIFYGHSPLALTWGGDGFELEIEIISEENTYLIDSEYVDIDGQFEKIVIDTNDLNLSNESKIKLTKKSSNSTGDWLQAYVYFNN